MSREINSDTKSKEWLLQIFGNRVNEEILDQIYSRIDTFEKRIVLATKYLEGRFGEHLDRAQEYSNSEITTEVDCDNASLVLIRNKPERIRDDDMWDWAITQALREVYINTQELD